MSSFIRRHDLDWLRVLVFALLIFYHVGMFFVPWGWHLKNSEIYPEIRWPMLFLNQWRLPILFVISGMGTYYALSRRSLKQYSWERYLRLGIPLLVGMLLVVPPQIYLERLVDGDFVGSYLDFYKTELFRGGPYPDGNISWHHLWFLPYLLLFSLLFGPAFVLIKRRKTRLIDWLNRVLLKPQNLYMFVIPLYFAEAFLEPFFPVTHALVGDWFNLVSSGFLFFFGFLLIACGEVFWQTLSRIKRYALLVGILSFSGLLVIWLGFEDSVLIHFTEALLKVTNLWSWILVLFGYSAKYLNRSSKILSYCNRAVYPFYILHQTITLIIAFYIMNLDWGFWPKAVVLIVGTFGFSWAIYHWIILPIKWLHPLFGLKRSVNNKPQIPSKQLVSEIS